MAIAAGRMGVVPVVQQEEQLGEAQGGAGHGYGGMAWMLANLGHYAVPAYTPPVPPRLHVLDSHGSEELLRHIRQSCQLIKCILV